MVIQSRVIFTYPFVSPLQSILFVFWSFFRHRLGSAAPPLYNAVLFPSFSSPCPISPLLAHTQRAHFGSCVSFPRTPPLLANIQSLRLSWGASVFLCLAWPARSIAAENSRSQVCVCVVVKKGRDKWDSKRGSPSRLPSNADVSKWVVIVIATSSLTSFMFHLFCCTKSGDLNRP